ncbi:MAG TPA: hypothetical protein VGB13_02305 [Candidatus Krumholzibacteria bacterium]|jgi:hypothetical protein
MHKAAKVALGCLLAPVGLLVLSVIFFAGLHMAGVPDADQTSTSLEQALPAAETQLVRSDGPVDDSLGVAAGELSQEKIVLVDLDLSEGAFTIIPGPAAEGIRVEADYDQGSYKLEQKYDFEGGRPRYRLRFGSTISFWRRIADDGSITDEELEKNQITVQLPRDTPMNLTLKMGIAQADIELDGLALNELIADFKMGEFNVSTKELNPIAMQRVELCGRMGEMSFEGVSYLRAATVLSSCAMGEVLLDLGGPLTRDTEIIAKMRMGEMRLNLPAAARWDSESRFSAQWGEINGAREGIENAAEDAALLSVDAAVFMGEMTLNRYRVRDTDLRRPKRD